MKKLIERKTVLILVFTVLVSHMLHAQQLPGRAGTPEQYGATGDGKTDDTKALRDCFSSHNAIFLSGRYLVTDTIFIRSNQQVYFQNAEILYTKNTGVIFYSADASDWQLSGKASISGAGLKEGEAIALLIEGGKNIEITGLRVDRFQGTAIVLKPGENSQRGNCVRLSSTAIINCWKGIKAFAASEYHSITGTNVIGCQYAVEIRSGNVTWTGGNIGDNTNGLFIGGSYGTNNSHGIFSGVNINHNKNYNIWCDSVQLGQTFSGCHVYGEKDKSIIISESKAVSFAGGIIDGRIAITASSPDQFHYFNGVQLEPYFNLTPKFSRAIFANCFSRDKGPYNHLKSAEKR